MRQALLARAESYEASRGRTPDEQRRLEERLAREFDLPLRPAKTAGESRPPRTA